MTSTTRLGSANTYDNALRNLSARQSTLANLQENLTSGGACQRRPHRVRTSRAGLDAHQPHSNRPTRTRIATQFHFHGRRYAG